MADEMTLKITRRRLTEILLGIVTLFFASGMISAILRYLWPKTSGSEGSEEVKIALVEEVSAGSTKMFNFHGKAAILLHTPAGFRAFGAVCTHLGCVAYWKDDESLIFCPCHLGRFDPNTGSVISGPPPSPLPVIETSQKEGAIYAVRWKDPDYVKSLSMYAGAA